MELEQKFTTRLRRKLEVMTMGMLTMMVIMVIVGRAEENGFSVIS